MGDLSLQKSSMPETLRPLGNFSPSLWGDRFSSFTLDTQLLEKYSKQVQVLKDEVKDMLVVDDVGGGKSGAEKMVLIDALERLGVSYLFKKEIEELLENMYPNFDKYSHVFHDNLFMVSLHFRIFRQHGYKLSSEVERSHVITGVECYMKQHGVSKPKAINELNKIIENAWMDINEEMMRPTMISKDLLIRVLNFARLYCVVYKNDDAYTKPEYGKDSIIALFEDSIPI